MRTWIRSGLVMSLLLGGCVGSTPPARFFTLTPEIDDSERASVHIAVDTVGVGPIELPRYLIRPQMVSRTEGNRLVVDEFARWGDSLDLQLGRTVTQNLARLCEDTLVLPFPWRADFEPDLRIIADVMRFEAIDTGVVHFDIRWAVTNVETREAISVHDSQYRSSVDPSDPASIASAMSETVAAFSREVALALAQAAEGLAADASTAAAR